MRIYKSDDFINPDEKIHMIKYILNEEEKPHRHEFIEMEYIWCGYGIQIINGTEYSVSRGDLLFFNFGDVHEFHSRNELGIINCLINPDFIAEELINSENAFDLLSITSFRDFSGAFGSTLPVMKFSGNEMIELEAILDFMVNEYGGKRLGYITALKGMVNVLLVILLRKFINPCSLTLTNDSGKIMTSIIEYIEKNFEKKISLKQLSIDSFYNPTYFSKLFKECFGKTLTEYIIQKRMRKSVELILCTGSSIEDISQMVGYNDKKQFYKHFKDFTGMTPSNYRKNANRQKGTHN